MRKIDIFVSSPVDVYRERATAERLIRSVAAEFNLPLAFSYSNPLRGRKEEKASSGAGAELLDEGTSWLCPCFWEYPDSASSGTGVEQVPNTGQFDFVICILGSRLGPATAPELVMPDGRRPESATDYEVAWALDQAARVPEQARLRVYRNRTSPPESDFGPRSAPLDRFFENWKQASEGKFHDACRDYRSLEEFEQLFREDFRVFVTDQLEREIVKRRGPRQPSRWGTNPFRSLNSFDFEQAPIFHGRTAAIVEIIDRLIEQAGNGSPFVLLLGDRGCGKSSLARAGILPFLSEAGEIKGVGCWRRAVTQLGPANSDPFDNLASALIEQNALPELQWAGDARGLLNLSLELRERPEAAANWLKQTLDRLGPIELSRLQDEQKSETQAGFGLLGLDLARQKTLRRLRPRVQLALVVDQLEQLFTNQYSFELQKKYATTLKTLVRAGGVFVIATLRSELYDQFAKFDELNEISGSRGKFNLQAPGPEQLVEMIRLPAREAGLRFERDIVNGQGLDDLILEAATKSDEPLLLLEHLLSQLYRRQARRKDGLLRLSDYRELGEFEGALANHAESLIAVLKNEEQSAFGAVMQRLVAAGEGEKPILRTVRYGELVSSADLHRKRVLSVRGLVDRFISAGLLKVQSTSKRDMTVSITSETVLQRWPRFQRWFVENRDFLRMKDKLDASLKNWESRGRAADDLLDPEGDLADAETLRENFRASLTKTELDYINRSLGRQQRHPPIRKSLGMAVGAAVALFVLGTAALWFFNGKQENPHRIEQGRVNPVLPPNQLAGSDDKKLESKPESANQPRTIIDAAVGQLRLLETKAEKDSETQRETPTIVDSAVAQLGALRRKITIDLNRTQKTQSIINAAVAQLAALGIEFKSDQEKAARMRATMDAAIAQLKGVETKIKGDQGKILLTRTTIAAAVAQLGVVGMKIASDQEKIVLTRKTISAAVAQLGVVGAQITSDQEKAVLTRKTIEAAVAQLNGVGMKIKSDQEKAVLTRTTIEAAIAQLRGVGMKTKSDQEKVRLTRKTIEAAVAQLNGVGMKIKSDQEKAFLTRTTIEAAIAQLWGVGTKARSDQEKMRLTRTTIEAAIAQLRGVGTKARSDQEKVRLTRKTIEAAVAQLNGVGMKIKSDQEKAVLTRKTIEAAVAQLKGVGMKIKSDQEKIVLTRKTIAAAVAQVGVVGAKIKSDQEKMRLTRTTIDAAVTQLNGVGTKIKSDQEKAFLTRTTIEAAIAQLRGVEMKTKSDQEKMRLTRTTIEAAVAQLNGVGTKIKSEGEKRRLTRVTISALSSQLKTVGRKIRSDRENVRLIWTTRDAVIAQLDAVYTKSESDKKRALQTRTTIEAAGAQLNLFGKKIKSDQEKGLQTRTTIDAAIAQLGILGKKIKSDQEKANQTRITVNAAVAQLGALGTTINSDRQREANTRVTLIAGATQLDAPQVTTREGQSAIEPDPLTGDLALKHPDSSRARNSAADRDLEMGIGASSTGELLVAPKPSEAKLEASKANQESGNFVPGNAAQLPVSGSSPPLAETEAIAPSQPKDIQGASPATEEDALKEFVRAYLRTVANDDLTTQKQFFADQVNFFGRGVLSQEKVQATTQQYHKEWPQRDWSPRGETKISKSKQGNVYLVHQPFAWTVSDGSRTAKGDSTLYLRIRKNAQGAYQIVKVVQVDH